MEEMIKVELPVDDWMEMERNHEIVEDFLVSVDIIGVDNAKVHLLHALYELIEEEME